MNDLAEVFNSAIEKSDKCGQCGTITARIGGDSEAHWCCNCGAKLRGNHPYPTIANIPPRIWDDEKKQYTYLKVPVISEVPMPEPAKRTYTNSKNSADVRKGYALSGEVKDEWWDKDQMRTYGEDCFSAGYVAGVKAENARCKQILTAKREHYDALPDRVLAAQCFDHAQILLGGWAYEAALRGEVKP